MWNHKNVRVRVIKLIYRSVLIVVLGVVALPVAQAQNGSVDYKIWTVFPTDTKGFTVVILSVRPELFNRQDMTSLAAKLNEEFGQKQKLKVGLLDDANAARLFVTGRLEIPDYIRAERGTYYLDRVRCKEYLRFLTGTRKPQNEVIRFKCSQAKKR